MAKNVSGAAQKAGCVEDHRYHRGIHLIRVEPRRGTKLPSSAYKIRLHGNARPGGQSDEPHMVVECLFWREMLGCGSGFRPHMVDAQGFPCGEFPKHGQPALGVKRQVMVACYPQDLVEVGGQKNRTDRPPYSNVPTPAQRLWPGAAWSQPIG